MTKREGARGDLFKEMKVPAPDAPGEAAYVNFLKEVQGDSEELPTEIGPDVIQRLLISLKQIEQEATMHRLKEVMAGHGYRLIEDDPDQPVFRKM